MTDWTFPNGDDVVVSFFWTDVDTGQDTDTADTA